MFFEPIYILRALNTGTCIHQGDQIYSAGLHRNHSQHRKNRERLYKKCRWMERKGRNKQGRNKSLAVSVACMAIYWPTPGFKGRTFKLCVLTRRDFNFCICSSPLWEIKLHRLTDCKCALNYKLCFECGWAQNKHMSKSTCWIRSSPLFPGGPDESPPRTVAGWPDQLSGL